jgi:hypothetical protein
VVSSLFIQVSVLLLQKLMDRLVFGEVGNLTRASHLVDVRHLLEKGVGRVLLEVP